MSSLFRRNLKSMFALAVMALFVIEFFKIILIMQEGDVTESSEGIDDVIRTEKLRKRGSNEKEKSEIGEESNPLNPDSVLKLKRRISGENLQKKFLEKISPDAGDEELKELKKTMDEGGVEKEKQFANDLELSGGKEKSRKENSEVKDDEKRGRSESDLGEIFINTSRPVLNPHPFKYILNAPDVCKDRKVFLLCYVHTAVKHFKRRKRIRQTWGNGTNYPGVEIQVVFFVGLPDLSTSEGRLHQDFLEFESKRSGDIVQENYLDTYHNLSYKGVGALKWVTTYCNHTDYVLKTDDDMFVNMYVILNHLRTLFAENHRRRLIMCYVFWLMHVDRAGGQWSLTKDYFPDDLYPPYCSGMGFVLSIDVAVAMYRVSPFVRFLWVDDAFISGVLPAALQGAVNHTSWARTYCGAFEMGVYVHQTEWYKYTFSHVHNETLYLLTWNGLSELAKSRSIPRPKVIRPGHLADEYIPLRDMFPVPD